KETLQRLSIYRSTEESTSTPPGPGRPKLGVVAREVSLLPRHWEWLSTQSGGASATLRRLVEESMKGLATSTRERIRLAQERTHKFMTAIAGDLPHFEEALRTLYAKDKKKLKEHLVSWPADIRAHVLLLSAPVFE